MTRKRRTKEEKQVAIPVTEEEFGYIIGFFNSLYRNLENAIHKELGYKLKDFSCSSITTKYSKIDKSVLYGNEKLNNIIKIKFRNSYYTSDVKDIFKKFAQNNRYLNITETCNSIKIENSDKYQYFNIIMKIEDDDVVTFNIYSRRLFVVSGKKHKNNFWGLF